MHKNKKQFQVKQTAEQGRDKPNLIAMKNEACPGKLD